MEYLSIKALSAKFAMPARTVYYNVANNPNIRVKKEGRTKLAHVADFARACGKELQILQTVANETVKSQSDSTIATLQKPSQDLQKKYEIVLSEKTNLEKYNRNLNENAQKYALSLKEEKEEKLAQIKKNERLQIKVEKFMQRYYLVLGLCMVLITILLFMNISDFLKLYQNLTR